MSEKTGVALLLGGFVLGGLAVGGAFKAHAGAKNEEISQLKARHGLEVNSLGKKITAREQELEETRSEISTLRVGKSVCDSVMKAQQQTGEEILEEAQRPDPVLKELGIGGP